MKHKSQKALAAQRIRIACLFIYELLKDDKVKEAIDVAYRNGIDAVTFGKIAGLVEFE